VITTSVCANTAGANALLQGGMGAAQTMGAANAYNPFATALIGASQNPALMRSASNLFGGGGAINQALYPSGNPLQTGAFADPGYWT